MGTQDNKYVSVISFTPLRSTSSEWIPSGPEKATCDARYWMVFFGAAMLLWAFL